MTRATTGHPTRAFAALSMAAMAWEGSRLPALRDGFVAELTMARAAGSRARHAATLPADAVATPLAMQPAAVRIASPPPVVAPASTVVVARATAPLPPRRQTDAPIRADGDRNAPGTAPALLGDALFALAADARPEVVPSAAGRFATDAYARLAAGDRRDGARLLDAAILAGGDPRVGAWTRDRDALRRRWSGIAYVVARRTGDAALAGTPVLGGGQAGAAIAFTPEPLARRPVSLTLRDFAATASSGIDGDSAQAAIGLSWRVMPGLSVTGERMIPLGAATRGAWSARVAGGVATHRLGVDAAAYAEAGIVGRARYAAAQLRVDRRVTLGRVAVHPGAGVWGSVQDVASTVTRVDVGPGLRIGHAALPVEVSIDYRVRLVGNAAPGSGPVVTLSTAF